MKLKIKILELTKGCFPVIREDGDWIDLKAAEDVILEAPSVLKSKGKTSTTFNTAYIPLGIAMQLPEGFEAIIAPRSSTCKKFNILQTNSIGVIDNDYCGPNDQWCFLAIAKNRATIKKGDRICQFRIQLSQKATVWQKLKWLFCSGVKLIKVRELKNPNRQGFGHSGIR